MDEIVGIVISFIVGIVLGWIACGMTIKDECAKIGAFVAGGSAYVCEVKK